MANSGGGFDVQLSYTYTEELYLQTFSVTVTDNEGGTGTGPRSSTSASTSTFSVADAALTAGALTPPVAIEAAAFTNTTIFHFTDADPAAAVTDYTAVVTLGDGNSVTLNSSGVVGTGPAGANPLKTRVSGPHTLVWPIPAAASTCGCPTPTPRS